MRLVTAFLCFLGTLASAAAGVPAGIGWTPFGAGFTAGYVDADGRLMLFDGGISGWTIRPVPYPIPLIPRAPIALLPQTAGSDWPDVVTVDGGNNLVRYRNGDSVQVLLPEHSFPAGTHVELSGQGSASKIFAVSGTGTLWCVDLSTEVGESLNEPSEIFPFGCPVAAISSPGMFHAFAVDQSGTLHYFSCAGGIWNSTPLAGSLLPGSHVATNIFPSGAIPVAMLSVAVVHPSGMLAMWNKPQGQPWEVPVIVASYQTPGASLAISNSAFGPMVSTIGNSGQWNVWVRETPVDWISHPVSYGFVHSGPVTCLMDFGCFMTIDPPGRLVCSHWNGDTWSTRYAVPGLGFSPQMVGREYVPDPPLTPAEITLQNSGDDPLLVQIVDLAVPRQPTELKIPPGSSAAVELERESGGVLKETFLIPGPAGILIEQTAVHPVAPEQRYWLVVWSDREVYRVLPFPNARPGAPKSVTEGFSRRSGVSLGVIPVPPGDLLREKEDFDLIPITRRLRNPGAVVHFPLPR